jgi:D-sedoheptulose 7-phosphate isomerase
MTDEALTLGTATARLTGIASDGTAAGTTGDIAAGMREHLGVVEAALALEPAIEAYAELLIRSLAAGGKVLTFGNGGSAADAQHLTGELIGRFRLTRRALPAVTLSVDPSVMTCIANDFGYDDVFARQVAALAAPTDLVIGFTTSGESRSVVAGLEAARAAGASTVALTGEGGGAAGRVADLTIAVPSARTARVQEVHTMITHLVSERIDAWVAAAEAPAEAPPSDAGRSAASGDAG